jgi:predicted transcriptional regulator
MSMTTIKVPVELRDRLSALAGREHITMADAVARALDAAEEAAFWSQVATTMGEVHTSPDAEHLSGTLADGLDPDETWDDVW